MSPAEVIETLARVNLAGAAAILLVLAARRPARAWFGPQVGYALWLAVPAAIAAVLLPARREIVSYLASAQAATPNAVSPVAMAAEHPSSDLRPWLIGLWIAGVLLSAALFAWRQRQLLASAGRLARTADHRMRRAHAAGVGPAVVGAFTPRVVVPSDFEDRFDAEERVLILAHEWAHLDRQDARINALVAAFQCAFWFNPLIHLGARAIRIDQELACDAAVIAQYPEARRRYAQAMLKTQITTAPLPFGCYWPAASLRPLKERIAMLKLKSPSRAQRLVGGAAIAALALGAGFAAWAAQPAQVILQPTFAPTAAAPLAAQVIDAPAPAPHAPTASRRVVVAALAPAAPEAVEVAQLPAPPPAPPAPPAPRAARPPTPPPPPAPPAPPAFNGAFVTPQMKLRCKTGVTGKVESCRMGGGQLEAGEQEVPLVLGAGPNGFAGRGRPANAAPRTDHARSPESLALAETARAQGDIARRMAEAQRRNDPAQVAELQAELRANQEKLKVAIEAVTRNATRIAEEASRHALEAGQVVPAPRAPRAPRAPLGPEAPVAPAAP